MEDSHLQRLDRTGPITQQDLRPSYGIKQDNNKGTSYVKSANNSPNSSMDRKVNLDIHYSKKHALSHFP